VFVELSCEHYLSDNKVELPDQIKRRGGDRALNWHSIGIKFREKIEETVKHIEKKSNTPDLAEIKRGLGSQDHLHSPENLHSYVHGLKNIPSATDLIIIWDRYNKLFKLIFS
jgi:hypothetical protein